MNFDSSPSDRVAQALDLYRSISACHDHLSRGDGAHAQSAAWLLPCYEAHFGRVVLQLTPGEEGELAHALRHITGSSEERAQVVDG